MAAKIAHTHKMKKYCLFLDDQRIPETVTWVHLPKVKWVIVRDYDEFIKTIEEKGLPEFIAFDHDLGWQHMKDYLNVAPIEEQIPNPLKLNYNKYTEKTGYDCAKWLVNYCQENNLPIPNYAVHSMNHIGRRNIESYLENYTKSTLKTS